MTTNPKIEVDMARDFTRYPAGRLSADGEFTGERFRTEFLVPPLRAGKKIRLLLDGAMGYGSSFLEEAFGGLTRVEGFTSEEILQRIEFVTDDPSLFSEIKEYLRQVPANVRH
jgi:hypothetical protein